MNTGPRRLSARMMRTRVSVHAGVWRGCDRATLDRSTSPAGPCSWNRRHHRHAVVRETPSSDATCATGRPVAIRRTMINLPAGVSRALA